MPRPLWARRRVAITQRMVTRRHCSNGFTLIEILVVIGIISMLIGLLVPVIERGREKAIVAKCASNLRQIGQAISMYCNDNHGAYPRTIYQPDLPPTKGTNPAAPDPFGAGGPLPNDMTAPFFLL